MKFEFHLGTKKFFKGDKIWHQDNLPTIYHTYVQYELVMIFTFGVKLERASSSIHVVCQRPVLCHHSCCI